MGWELVTWPWRALRVPVDAFRLWKRLQADADARICLGFKRQQEILSERVREAQARDDAGEEERAREMLRRVQDNELSYQQWRLADLATHVLADRAPTGVIAPDLPQLPEPDRAGLERAATALAVLRPAQTAAEHFVRGRAFYRADRFDSALEHYNAALALRPDDPAILERRGATLGKLKRYKEALADYNRSLELRPDHASTIDNRGVTLRYLNRYKEALADFNRALQLQPGHPNAVYNRACLLALTSHYEEALTDLREAVARDGKYRGMAREDEDFEGLRNDPQWGPKFWELVETED